MTVTDEPLASLPEGPRNVLEAIASVIRELPAIAKGEKSPELGYAFRGIEAMTGAVQPLLGRYGIVPVPQVLSTEKEAITKGGRPWVHREMSVQYQVYGPGGRDDMLVVGPFLAEADDNSDKAANKCMTQAYKQMLLQLLCISDRKDDPDEHSVERDEPQPDPLVHPDVAAATYARAEADGYTRAELDETVAVATGARTSLADVSRGEWKQVAEAWRAFKAEHPRDPLPATPAPSGDDPPAPPGEVSTATDDAPEGGSAGRAALGTKARP